MAHECFTDVVVALDWEAEGDDIVLGVFLSFADATDAIAALVAYEVMAGTYSGDPSRFSLIETCVHDLYDGDK